MSDTDWASVQADERIEYDSQPQFFSECLAQFSRLGTAQGLKRHLAHGRGFFMFVLKGPGFSASVFYEKPDTLKAYVGPNEPNRGELEVSGIASSFGLQPDGLSITTKSGNFDEQSVQTIRNIASFIEQHFERIKGDVSAKAVKLQGFRNWSSE